VCVQLCFDRKTEVQHLHGLGHMHGRTDYSHVLKPYSHDMASPKTHSASGSMSVWRQLRALVSSKSKCSVTVTVLVQAQVDQAFVVRVSTVSRSPGPSQPRKGARRPWLLQANGAQVVHGQ